MQWYAFHEEPAGGVDAPNGKSLRFLICFYGLHLVSIHISFFFYLIFQE